MLGLIRSSNVSGAATVDNVWLQGMKSVKALNCIACTYVGIRMKGIMKGLLKQNLEPVSRQNCS